MGGLADVTTNDRLVLVTCGVPGVLMGVAVALGWARIMPTGLVAPTLFAVFAMVDTGLLVGVDSGVVLVLSSMSNRSANATVIETSTPPISQGANRLSWLPDAGWTADVDPWARSEVLAPTA